MFRFLKSASICSICTCAICLAIWAVKVHSLQPTTEPKAEFQVGKDGRLMLIKGTANGSPVTFLVDTGASKSVFDARLRQILGESHGLSRVNTTDGEMELHEFSCPEIVLGDLKIISDQSVYCCDMQEQRMVTGEDFSAVLGMDILRRYVVSLNFDDGIVRFFEELPTSPQACGQPIELSFEANCPRIKAKWGSIEQSVSIDTGATDSCIESRTFQVLSDFGDLEVGPEYAAMTPYGRVATKLGLLHQLSFGPFMHQNLVCAESQLSLLGLSYLSRYDLLLDFPNSTAYFQRGSRYAKADYRGTSGLSLHRAAGRLLVKSVRPQGPAAIAGVQIGDEVVEINGETALKMDMFRAKQLLTSDPGQSAKLKLVRNAQPLEVSFIIRDRVSR
jgi:predicted aspartyl protease